MEALTLVLLFGYMLYIVFLMACGLLLLAIIGGLVYGFVKGWNQTTKHPRIPVPDDTSEALEPGQVPLRR